MATSEPKWYWCFGPGRAKWATSLHPFTALRRHLAKYVDPIYLDRVTADWFHLALGFYPGTPHIGPVPLKK